MLSWFAKKRLAIKDCASNILTQAASMPFRIGAGSDSDLKFTNADSLADCSAVFSESEGGAKISMFGKGYCARLNSSEISESAAIESEKLYSLQIGRNLYYVYYGKNWRSLETIDSSSWIVFDGDGNKIVAAALSFGEIPSTLRMQNRSIANFAVIPSGCTEGFWVRDLFPEIRESSVAIPPDSEDGALARKIDEDYGEFVCPSCWLHFNADDVNYVSVHADLLGDPILGDKEQLRFLPSQYNPKGVPMDPMGVSAHEIACPHCHRKLPATFLSSGNSIISIVGSQSSGKSYFLSVLLRSLPEFCFKNFDMAFVDADPSLNVAVNEMMETLFRVPSPENVRLEKTTPDGNMYDIVVRYGRKVPLPKPFFYLMGDIKNSSGRSSVTLYDNAGSDFEPSPASDEVPGAMHIAASDAVIFLFDPLNSANFRLNLDPSSDPQLENASPDMQSLVLAETAARIKRLNESLVNLRRNVPFAFVVNKCDALNPLFDMSSLAPCIADGTINFDAIAVNSAKIRDFLASYVPDVLVNAEMISDNVKYFMASPLGHSPRFGRDENGKGYLSPEISKIKPFNVELPFLWAVSQIDGTPLNMKFTKPKPVNDLYVF